MCTIQSKIKSKSTVMQDQKFGPFPIKANEQFAHSKTSFAFVNLKPIVEGGTCSISIQTLEDLLLFCNHELDGLLWELHIMYDMLQGMY